MHAIATRHCSESSANSVQHIYIPTIRIVLFYFIRIIRTNEIKNWLLGISYSDERATRNTQLTVWRFGGSEDNYFVDVTHNLACLNCDVPFEYMYNCICVSYIFDSANKWEISLHTSAWVSRKCMCVCRKWNPNRHALQLTISFYVSSLLHLFATALFAPYWFPSFLDSNSIIFICWWFHLTVFTLQ